MAWKKSLVELERRSRVDSLELLITTALAPSPDGKRVLIAARHSGVRGVAVLDAGSHDPVDFIGPSVAADGSVYAGDYGDGHGDAGGGIPYRYSADLGTIEPIDLSAAAVSGWGPTIQGVTGSKDGRSL